MNNTVKVKSQVVDIEKLNEDMEREIAASELRYQRWSRGMVHLGDGKVRVTEEMSGMHWVDLMEKVAKRIATTDEGATKIAKTISGSRRVSGVSYQLTPLGRDIWGVCKEAVPRMELLYPGCRLKESHPLQPVDPGLKPNEDAQSNEVTANLNPYLAVMLRACQRAKPTLREYGQDSLDVNQRVVRLALERLLAIVRRVCRSRRFKYVEGNYTRNEPERLRSCCQYMAAAFAECSKLLIMRVDLYFLPEHKGWANTLTASKSLRRFLRALREDRIVPDVKAWVCKRENAFRRGIHLHLLVAMDGHKHREAATFSKMIGEAWVDRFSDGHGSYFNCWARRHEYALNGLGLVHVSDRKMLMGLREALRYMTKTSCHMTTGYRRNLWKGIMRRSWKAVKRGAPRKPEHDMSLVNEILGDV